MDFFEHQAQAKAASNRLLLLFLAFCVFIVLCVNGVIYVCLSGSTISQFATAQISLSNFLKWQFSYAGFITSVVTLAVIGSGCVGRWLELRHGGNGMAVKLGARSLGFASKDETEQKLINVVEEMAIAAGVTSPGVYVLDHERSINAFVVGYEFEDSALVVTNGLLQSMNRDELQAVVGHEFSHILHGDNCINIRLMILLGGIVWVSELGKMLMMDSRHRYGRQRPLFGVRNNEYQHSTGYNSLSGINGKKDSGALFIGLPLLIIGYVGIFFGRLIRTAISRKREYLADAASVQFTRNPEALASALNIIRTNGHQGFLQIPRAEGISHMCISSSQKSTWFATHPPLENRINSIDPTFILRFESREKKQQRNEQREQKNAQQTQAAKNMYQPDVTRLQSSGGEHLHDVIGSVEKTVLEYIVRDHDFELFTQRKKMFQKIAKDINEKIGQELIQVDLKDQYFNMKEKIIPVMHIVDIVEEVMKDIGITPIIKPIRGGTDGSQLSYKGLPCPNIFAGGHNFHGRYEYIPVESMIKATEVIVGITAKVAEQYQ